MLSRESLDQSSRRWRIAKERTGQRGEGLCNEAAPLVGHKCQFRMTAMSADAPLPNGRLACRLRSCSAVRHALHACGRGRQGFMMAAKLRTAANSADVENRVRTQQQP